MIRYRVRATNHVWDSSILQKKSFWSVTISSIFSTKLHVKLCAADWKTESMTDADRESWIIPQYRKALR